MGLNQHHQESQRIGEELFVCHVGDSRAYLFRDGKLEQLTRDHTHVQQLVDAGTITREEAATHRLRHVLTNAIGGRHRSIDVDVQRVRLQDADRLLFCTDGLTEVVPDGVTAEETRPKNVAVYLYIKID